MNLPITLSLALLMLQSSCDASREGIERTARLFFPMATVEQTDHLMVVFTCTKLSELAADKIAPIISKNLADAKGSDAIISSGWRTLAVGFENQIVSIDMTNMEKRPLIAPADSFRGYTLRYVQKCGPQRLRDGGQ